VEGGTLIGGTTERGAIQFGAACLGRKDDSFPANQQILNYSDIQLRLA
jgi:hypothetical protein